MEENPSLTQPDLVGVKQYAPGVVAAYTALWMPVGFYLYGLNILRRGERWFGRFFIALGPLIFCGMAISAGAGLRRSGLGIIGIFVALGVFQMEGRPYKRALLRGAVTAKWWPPLILSLVGVLILILILTFIAPT